MALSRTIVGEPDLKILSERLRQCRKDAGLTQAQLAIYADITEKAYQNYEALRREPKLEILVRIADTLDVSLDYLVGRSDEKKIRK
jgi:transcriptional regulator with XRE-family HTH domain